MYLNCLQPGHDYDAPFAGPPVPQRLTIDRPCGQDLLEAVPAGVTPKISGAAAYARCDRCGKHVNMTEELAYYSAATPATLPAGCEPVPNVPMPAVCNGPGTPVYNHRLVWFFIEKGHCQVYGAVNTVHNRALEDAMVCVWLVPEDASNGSIDYSMSG
jgi:hypothetical protein